MSDALPLDPLLKGLVLPLIAAPMFLVSGPELVIAACRAGIVGALPASNARTTEQLDIWLTEIGQAVKTAPTPHYAVNINVHPGRYRDFEGVVAALERARVPLVITSVGDPADMVRRVHGWGGRVFHDVTTIRHAQKAIEAGVDGLILVCAGAGGHAGSVSAFSFLRAVRRFYDGTIVLGGGIADGFGLGAAIALGADFAYMGTRFIASREAMASDAYKQAVVDAQLGDVVYTNAISGLPANFLKAPIVKAGMDPRNMPPLDVSGRPVLPEGMKAWKDLWSAGHAVSLTDQVLSVAQIVDSLKEDFERAVMRMQTAARQFG